MQQIVQMTPAGKVNDFSLTFLLRLDGAWVPIERAGDYNVRVIQVIESSKSGWLALIERTVASTLPSPA